ncbi:MAG TPA: serine/threonine-protein kinase [Pyrinomonadaceae bacterium]|jgi:serine/threonine protein kinase
MIEPGTLLQNRYRVVKQIGQGGMGAVYVATDERFHSTVAVKQTLFDDAALRKAFEREAQLLNHLRHAALPKVSDHFIEGTGQFLVMEYIEGSDLSDLLDARNGGAFPCADVLAWADELLNALDYLHTQTPPIIHRDIKPQNLKLTTRGQIVLLDFGLAKGTPLQMHASTTASIFGYSRNYAPLEQIQGTGTDARSDLYSLGATLYHLLTGTAPVDALTRASAIVNNQPDPLLPAHLMREQIPAAVGGVLHRALAQNAALRPQTAGALRAALRQAANTTRDEATLVDDASFTPEGQQPTIVINHTDRATTQMRRPALPGEISRTRNAAHRSPSRTTQTRVAHAPAELPARRSPKLIVAAAIALLVACVSVPLLLRQRAAAPAAVRSDATLTDASGATTNAPNGTTSGPAQSEASSAGLANTEPTPAAANDPAAAAQTNAAPATNAASTNPPTASTSAGSEANGQTSPTGISTAARPGLEIHNPIPAATPDDGSAARELAARRAEEARKAEETRRADEARRAEEARRAADEARHAEDMRRIDEMLRRAGPPPDGQAPPFGGGPPPPPPGCRPPLY